MSADCQVDFYVLHDAGPSAARFSCHLALMAWEKGHRIAVLTADRAAADDLDALMWEHPPGRFLPHSLGTDEPDSPIRIETHEADIGADRDVLINLSPRAVTDPGRFSRLLEIVPGTESERSESRNKFRRYRDMGLQPTSHPIGG